MEYIMLQCKHCTITKINADKYDCEYLWLQREPFKRFARWVLAYIGTEISNIQAYVSIPLSLIIVWTLHGLTDMISSKPSKSLDKSKTSSKEYGIISFLN